MSTYSTPIPGTPGIGQANLLARRAYENAMARLQQRRSRTLQQYGYQRDPSSGALSVDPNNEYGQYQQMLKGADMASRRLDRSQRAGGWSAGSGYLGAQREDLQYQQGDQARRLGTALTDELAGLSQEEQGAEYDRDAALYQNELGAAQRAIDQGNFNPANYSGMDIPDYEEPMRDTGRLRTSVHQRGRERLVRRAARRGRRR